MNHYETLGVDATAGPDDIRSAYRKRAMACHPDRGGDAGQMATVNRAYETLSDPERRAKYDASGSDQEDSSIQQEACGLLSQIFQRLIDGDSADMVLDARASLANLEGNAAQAMAMANREKKRLGKARERITARDGHINLAHNIIDQKVAALDQSIAQAARALEVRAAADLLLDAYESVLPAYQMATPTSAGFSFGSGWNPA